jgi:hypothetical protein
MRSAVALLMLGVLGMCSLPDPARAQATHNSVTLSWTAPGDDSLTGTAAQYDLRYATSAITAANFGSASRWTGIPSPTAAGTRQSATITGLQPSTTYYFAIKTADEVPNWAGISNIISRTTLGAPDSLRPAQVATLAITGTTETSATMRWTAVGDDSLTGTATTNAIRYSTSPITSEASWNTATSATGEPAPTAAGTQQTFTLNGLNRQTTYYVAIKVIDEAGHWSALSNVVSVTTPDLMPPAAIRDLTVGFLWLGWNAGISVEDSAVRTSHPPRAYRRR